MMLPEDSASTVAERLRHAIPQLMSGDDTPAIAVYHTSGKIVFWNEAAEHQFGYRASFVVDTATYEMLHPGEDISQYMTAENGGHVTGRFQVEAVTRMRDVLPVEVTYHVLSEDGSDPLMVAVYRINRDA